MTEYRKIHPLKATLENVSMEVRMQVALNKFNWNATAAMIKAAAEAPPGLNMSKVVYDEAHGEGFCTPPPRPPLPLPGESDPSPWASALLFIVVSSHILFHLMTYWLVRFRAASLYCTSSKIGVGAWLQIWPQNSRGKPGLVRHMPARSLCTC